MEIKAGAASSMLPPSRWRARSRGGPEGLGAPLGSAPSPAAPRVRPPGHCLSPGPPLLCCHHAVLSPHPWPCRELCPCEGAEAGVMDAARSPVSFGWVPGTSPCSRCLHLVKNSVSSPGYMFPCHCRCPLFQCITRHQYITRFLFPLYTYVWSRLSVKLFPQVRAHPCRLQGALQAGGLISRWGLSPEENQV